MPRLETKTIYQELEQGWVWPVYFIYGPERLRVRELVKRIREAVEKRSGALGGLGTEVLEGTEITSESVVECSRTLALGGGIRLTLVRDAHALPDPDRLADLFGPRVTIAEAEAVTVLLAKDLDQRRKFSKAVLEKAAVVECAEVRLEEREAWIRFLAKRRGMLEVDGEVVQALLRLEPWGLEMIDSELTKLEIAGSAGESLERARDVLTIGAGGTQWTEQFLEGFFVRDRRKALEAAERFAHSPEEAIPLLGLFAWNARQVAVSVGGGAGPAVRGPMAERLRRWARHWKLDEVIELQKALASVDFGMKQTPKLGLGHFTDLVSRFAR